MQKNIHYTSLIVVDFFFNVLVVLLDAAL